jgi:hypothetical protein
MAIQTEIIKKLGVIPKKAKKDFHYWADYIEILCLINKDGITSQNDFIDRLKKQRDEEDSEEFDKVEKNSKKNERVSLFAEDCFKLLESRVSTFKNYYPFIISEDNKSIHLKNPIDLQQKIYLFLLMSSSLGYFETFNSELTSSFERLSLGALKNILPPRISKSFIFGSSNIEKIEDETERNNLFWDKLQGLTTTLKEKVNITKEQLSKNHKGDGGLDLVAWIDLGDNNRHFPMYFCQCACTPEWNIKQNSIKFDRWNNFMSFSNYPLNIIFIPFAFRSSNGDWHEEYLIEKTILFDRQRLLYNFKGIENEFLEYESSNIIDQIVTQKESVV